MLSVCDLYPNRSRLDQLNEWVKWQEMKPNSLLDKRQKKKKVTLKTNIFQPLWYPCYQL